MFYPFYFHNRIKQAARATMMLLIARFDMLIVLRLLRSDNDEYLHEQMLRLNKSEARVILLYATQYDNLLVILRA